jgi:hypothetical protein
MSLQPVTASAVLPFVPCQSCSWPMRLTLVAPLWDHGDAETHTYECSCCKHRQSFKRSIKQYAAAVAGPKPVVQIRGESRDHRTVGMAGRTVGHDFARSAGSQR